MANMAKLIFILGGARSGKSSTAERLALELGGEHVLYVATAQAYDDEMRERIAAHQQQRPAGWHTLEAPQHVAEEIRQTALTDVILLDCITLLASNALLTLPETCSQAEANAAILSEIDDLLALQQTSTATWIIVSNEVGMGIVPPYRLGRLYRDALGAANQRIALVADEVLLMVAGLAWRLK
ncbi:MAG: bifunctional adenosylcobinamide kinase/adenosylcobinamide-phosphate guanylyltransferase [Chloroflexota bacterium]